MHFFPTKSAFLFAYVIFFLYFCAAKANCMNLEQLFRSHYPRLKNYAKRFTACEEDAEDIVQQTFLRIMEQPDGKELTPALLFCTTRNLCLDYLKHHAVVAERLLQVDDEALAEGLYAMDMAPSAEQDTICNELRAYINQLIDQMPARQKEVFLLSREQQLKNQEIANQLGISLKAVEKHITASIKYLREHLSTEYLLVLLLVTTNF